MVLSTTIGATTGPVRGITFPFASGGFGAAFPGFTGGGNGGSLKYFNAKSETMSCFSESFAFNLNDASGGIARTRSPAMFVKPYHPDLTSGPVIVTVPLIVFTATFKLLTRLN